jgi:hypothetical protein
VDAYPAASGHADRAADARHIWRRAQKRPSPRSSVGSPPLIKRSGAGACTTASSQARQAYLGRCVTSTRNRAGITSSRSELSSPTTCITPWQQG